MLPGRKGSEGRPAKDNRLFVEAVLYRYRAGIPWRDLPERFGDDSVAKFGCPRDNGLNPNGADHVRVQVASF